MQETNKSHQQRSQETVLNHDVPIQNRLESQGVHEKSVTFAEGTKKDNAPIIPENESPEDAALRRQMLRYNMDEVGAIVAEMNLDDDQDLSSSRSGNDEHEFESSEDEADYDDEDEDNDEEDIYGRTSTRVLSDDYMAEMRALEDKLKAQAILNTGPKTPKAGQPSPELTKQSETHKEEFADPKHTSQPKMAGKKGVRFAEELDIQDAPPKSESAINDSHTVVTGSNKSKKLSRFKATRVYDEALSSANAGRPLDHKAYSTSLESQPPSQAIPPANVHSAQVIEREVVLPSSQASDADESEDEAGDADNVNSALMDREIRSEYHRLRNRQIHREGGFGTRGDDKEMAEIPLTEEEGGPKKVSRFKAAQLGRGRQ